MKHRHATNLRTPFDVNDQIMFLICNDYRLGPPVAGTHSTALTLEQLVAQGYVGFYLTIEELMSNDALRRRTGWTENVLGSQELSDGA